MPDPNWLRLLWPPTVMMKITAKIKKFLKTGRYCPQLRSWSRVVVLYHRWDRVLVPRQAMYQRESRKRLLAGEGWGRRFQAFVTSKHHYYLNIELYIASFLCDLPPTPNSTHWKHCRNIFKAQLSDRSWTNHLQWISSMSRYLKEGEVT